jgi:putative methionine-R-sulfoxide reductase with GAF domain
MEFLRNRSLKQLSVIIPVAILVLIAAEFLWLQRSFSHTESVQYQIDFVRTIQLNNERLTSQLTQLQPNSPLVPATLSLLEQIEQQLKLVETGGRIPGSEIFLKPLQRLPKITYENLNSLWTTYKKHVLLLHVHKNNDPGEFALAQSQALRVSDWLVKLSDDLYDEASKSRDSKSTTIILIFLIDTLFMGLLAVAFYRYILAPLKYIETNTTIHEHTHGIAKNEIGSLAFQVNEVIEQLRDATDFVKGIGEGKLDMDYKAELDVNYAPGKQKLADELIAMQTKLKTISEEERRRKWANEGLTKFVDILRNANNNVQELGDKIISTLVQYTGSNQGGLYVLNDEDESNRFLELMSLFAFDIKKFQKQNIKLGEGILGQTFLEKETTHLTNMPDEYTRITSGLGDAPPKSLLIVPLKVDKDVYGIVELASFRAFEQHEISFVEKLGETIASTLSSVKVNHRNAKLLEQSQQQTEEMKAQEEEMRQNMEELTATQEGMNRLLKEAQEKEVYLNNLMDATSDAIAAVDREYKVVLRNNAPLFDSFRAHGIKYEKGYYVLGLFKTEELEYHKGIYDKAFGGETVNVTKEYFGRKYSVSYNPLHSERDEIIGVSIFAHDETELNALKDQLASGQFKEAPDNWKLAEEMEKTFRVQLEALKITQEELTRKL